MLAEKYGQTMQNQDKLGAKHWVQEHIHRHDAYEQPLLLMSRAVLKDNVERFKAAMPRVTPHFAVKCSPDPKILSCLKDAGASFEVASKAELDSVMDLGVAAEDILYSHPIKSRDYIRYAAVQGVVWYCVDSVEELDKIVEIHPQAKLYLRIHVANESAMWPLHGKFGALEEEYRDIIARAVETGANLSGVTFHVGSQCRDQHSWSKGIEQAAEVIQEMEGRGLNVEMLDLGGGFPVKMEDDDPMIECIGKSVNQALELIPERIRVVAEPGRNLVANAGCFVSRVVGTATHQGQRWLYLDAGTYGGLIESLDGFNYPILTEREGPTISWTVAGPTCDSVDVCQKHVQLPAEIVADDFIYLMDAGAYTVACASRFNGFELPKVELIP